MCDIHVLYLIDSLVPAGAERSLLALAPRYVASGVRLDVGHLHDRPGLHGALTEAGANVICLAGRGGRTGWVKRTHRLVRERRADLIHTTLFEADVAGRIAGAMAAVPVVSSLVNIEYGAEQLADPRLVPWKVRAAQALDAATAQWTRRFHAITAHVAEVMGRRLHVARERIDVVPRGREPEELGVRSPERRRRTRAAIGVDGATALVLAVGRQEYQKGLDVLLRALPWILHGVPDALLLVAGREGNQTPELRATVAALGVEHRVRFLGSRTDVPDLLSAADVFVLPSRWEGLGSVLIEAMALETPIVASGLPAVREVTDGDATARLVPVGDAEALAGAVVESLLDAGETIGRSTAARRRFLRYYTVEKVADGMLAFYERALAGPAGRSNQRTSSTSCER